MLKVVVSYGVDNGTRRVNDRKLVVKTDVYDGKVQAELLKNISLFTPELRMYSETLTAMEEVMKELGIKDLIQCSESLLW